MISNLGKVEKLMIHPYTDPGYTDKSPLGPFTALINPETFTQKYKTEYCETQGSGSSGVSMKFSKMTPQEFNFDFLFDGTGVVKDSSVLNLAIPNPFDESKNIDAQIDKFKLTVFEYDGDMHRPFFLMIIWGTHIFKGVLTSMDIEYKLFNHDGSPLRAIAKCAFKGSIEDTLRIAKDDPKSPDITHERTFRSGDMLPLMSDKIYSDQSYYIDVAKANGLDGFRDIKAGTLVYFIPLEK